MERTVCSANHSCPLPDHHSMLRFKSSKQDPPASAPTAAAAAEPTVDFTIVDHQLDYTNVARLPDVGDAPPSPALSMKPEDVDDSILDHLETSPELVDTKPTSNVPALNLDTTEDDSLVPEHLMKPAVAVDDTAASPITTAETVPPTEQEPPFTPITPSQSKVPYLDLFPPSPEVPVELEPEKDPGTVAPPTPPERQTELLTNLQKIKYGASLLATIVALTLAADCLGKWTSPVKDSNHGIKVPTPSQAPVMSQIFSPTVAKAKKMQPVAAKAESMPWYLVQPIAMKARSIEHTAKPALDVGSSAWVLIGLMVLAKCAFLGRGSTPSVTKSKHVKKEEWAVTAPVSFTRFCKLMRAWKRELKRTGRNSRSTSDSGLNKLSKSDLRTVLNNGFGINVSESISKGELVQILLRQYYSFLESHTKKEIQTILDINGVWCHNCMKKSELVALAIQTGF